MALEPGRHRTKEQRARVIQAVKGARNCTGLPISRISAKLGIPRASYYRYLKIDEPRKRKPRAKAPPLTPAERLVVREVALAHPLTGYKRLTYMLQNEHVVGARPHQVLGVLREENLIMRREAIVPCLSKRPTAPVHPDEVWHIDIMYLWLASGWWYLVDILDGYSRYLVHWTLNDSLGSETVSLTVLEALEARGNPKPAIVHDRGTQFESKEWKTLIDRNGLPNIRIRPAHPQSNGLIERMHRTHRDEGVAGFEEKTIAEANEEMARWAFHYNNLRPHGALKGLPPVVYYLGEPDAALAQREHFVQAAAEVRANYWRHQQAGSPVWGRQLCLTSS